MTTIMPGEEEIFTINEEELVLTTQRIQFEDETHHNVELPLEQVSNVTIQHRGYKSLLISGSLCVLVGIVSLQKGYNLDVVFIAGLMMLVFWWLTRKRILNFGLRKGKAASVDVDELSGEEVHKLVDGILQARNNRLNEIGMKLV